MSQLFHSNSHESEIADLVQLLPQQDEKAFWQDRLRGAANATFLGNSRDNGSPDDQIARLQFTIPELTRDNISHIAKKLELSKDTMFIAAWAFLLSRHSAEKQALFGVRFSSLHGKADRLWPLLTFFDNTMEVSDWLKRTQQLRDDICRREPVSLRDLHLWCEVPLEQKLIETVLDFSETKSPSTASQALELRFAPSGSAIEFIYHCRHFASEVIVTLAEQFLCLLKHMSDQLEQPIASLNILPASQREKILKTWNATDKSYPSCNGLQELVERQVAANPDAIAVEFTAPGVARKQCLTFGELNARANRLARFLQANGVGPDVVVGICVQRSIEMAIAVLAAIKAGGAYAPLDPAYPKERLIFMIEDTKAPIILTQSSLLHSLPSNSAKLFCLDKDMETIAHENSENLPCHVQQDNLAYLIYTSGSTGKPKGVAMRQGPLINLLFWQMENWSSRPTARTLQFASLNFDVSFQEIFSTWCSGGTLVLIPDEERRDANALVHFIAHERVERLFLPFVALKHFAEAAEREKLFPSALREIITAGEQLQITPQVINFFSKVPRCTLENQYGPSETHVVTACRLHGTPDQWPPLPSIGRPIANTQIYLLNEWKQPVPVGVTGELYIGGVCLARGYLNRPDLTEQRFIHNPFSKNSNSRLYKTGDLARWMPDGNIEFLGRADHQVKIRGFRIELGEIETVLSKHPGVREAIVAAQDAEAGDKRLVAYIVPQNGAITSAELRSFLKQRVPEYSIPSAFVSLPKLPLTPNGKVDRKSLPKPTEIVEPVGSLKLPQDPLEMQLKLVFEKLLHRRPIGIDVSFFELGGDSLQALKLLVEIEKATGKKLPLGILYQAATVEGLAKVIREQTGTDQWSALVPLQPNGKRPPLFLVHTTPGDVLGYGNLIYHLDPDQPSFGFQSLGFFKPELSHTRIDEMAAYYVKLMRGLQPRGPYYLGGWCYGGMVAVEMAHQLVAAGEKVAPLLLIETPAPAPRLSNFYYFVRRFGCLMQMNPGEWKTYLTAKYRYYSGLRANDEMRFRRISESKSEDKSFVDERNRTLAKLEHVYRTNLRALDFYQSRPYPGRIILFNAKEQDPAIIRDPQYGWPGLAQNIETHTIPGSHDTILMEPNVRVLAKKMNECLLNAQRF